MPCLALDPLDGLGRSREEARLLLGVVSLPALMGRLIDSLVTVTYVESVGWAATDLVDVGWEIGKTRARFTSRGSGVPGSTESHVDRGASGSVRNAAVSSPRDERCILE